MTDPCALSGAVLFREWQDWSSVCAASRLRLDGYYCEPAWDEYLTLRERLSFAEDRLAAVEAEIARRERDR